MKIYKIQYKTVKKSVNFVTVKVFTVFTIETPVIIFLQYCTGIWHFVHQKMFAKYRSPMTLKVCCTLKYTGILIPAHYLLRTFHGVLSANSPNSVVKNSTIIPTLFRTKNTFLNIWEKWQNTLKIFCLLSKFESVKIYWLSVKFDWFK